MGFNSGLKGLKSLLRDNKKREQTCKNCYVVDTSLSLFNKSWCIRNVQNHPNKYIKHIQSWGTRWRSWLRHCATSWKVAGSIPDGVIGFFSLTQSFRPYYGPGVDSASNRNEYQECFLGVKAAGA